jgi:glycosyltransferase involved in cell wall biosynthesis
MARKLRVAMVCENLDPTFGGQAVTIPELVRALRQEGVYVKVFAGTNLRKKSRALVESTESHSFYYIGEKLKLSVGLLLNLYAFRKDFDIVHCNNLWNMVPVIAFVFCVFTGKGFVVSLRGMAMEEEVNSKNWKKISFRVLFKHILNRASFLHSTYDGETKNLQALNVNNTIVEVGHGLSLPEQPKISSEVLATRKANRTLLFVGRVCDYKNVHKIIEGFLEFETRRPGWRLKIVGPLEDETYARLLKRQISQAKADEKVTLCGFQAGDTLTKTYWDATVFVNASNSENFGMSIAEALSFGIPCIVPTRSPWRSVTEHKVGIQVEPTARDITCALDHLVENILGDELLGPRAQSILKSISWAEQARKMIKGYETNVGSR